MALPNTNSLNIGVTRVRIWYGALLIVMMVFGVRLFYVQIIRYDHYKNAALSDQLKQHQIPASRGIILARDGEQTVPIVLNQRLYRITADPTYVKNVDETARQISGVLGGNVATYASQLRTPKTRYVVLAKKQSASVNDKILKLKLPGIYSEGLDYRTYPQNDLAAQLLGFVDESGSGRYGLEEALDAQLKGRPGQLKAITDIRGVPLAASRDNTQVPAQPGDTIVLSVDVALQQQLQTILQQGVQDSHGASGSALVLDAQSGAVKAMANYPSYDPAKYGLVEDGKLFQNASVTEPIEVGSIMKTLTTAAALDQKVINANTSYYDPATWKVNGFNIRNVEEDGGAGTRSIADILNLSLNTGVTWELMQMGGGEINDKARTAWYDYMANHYRLGKATGIETSYESSGYVPKPADNGAAINLTYANTAFGQAVTATPIQMAAAFAAAVNGGTYYQPHLVEQRMTADGKTITQAPKVLNAAVVSKTVSQDLIPLLQNSVNKHNFRPTFDQDNYIVGGKTGTAQIAKPGGGYYDDRFNGTYLGFVGGDKAQYVIVVFVERPTLPGYAGTTAAQPIFGKLAHLLIDESLVAPKTK